MPKTPVVTHIDLGPRPPCEVKVHLSSVPTRTLRQREFEALQRGRAADQCAAPAAYRFNEVPMCAAHAGQRALAFLTGEKL